LSGERWRAGASFTPAGDELAELQELLLGGDRQRIRELERRLDAAGVTGEELAELLPEAIVLRARRDRQLARALAPTIEGAISESVRRNPREIATAIFPVLGPAIRKAIAETFAAMAASINRALEHSISPRGLAWRVESWRTGVPYAQIVLRHALVYRVEQVFLIHTDTGLLLAHAAPADLRVADADLISGMLTAIRDFVGDAFGPERDAGGLRTFCVGELTVVVEHGPSAVLAAVVRGQAPETLHPRLQETLEAVHSQFSAALAAFQGDAEPFAPAVPLLEECLETKLATGREGGASRRAVWAVGAAMLLLGAAAGWLFYRASRQWDAAVLRLEAEPGIAVLNAERGWMRRTISGLRDPLAADPAALLAAAGIDTSAVSARWVPYLSADPQFVRARLGPGEALLPTERAIRRERALFAVGSSAIDDSARRVVSRVATALGRLDSVAALLRGRPILTLVGRSDPTGSDAANAALSRLRVEAVRSVLIAGGADSAALEVRALGASAPLPAEDPVVRSTINRSVSFEVRVE
jgi:OOP family OmpA-OmpF porin